MKSALDYEVVYKMVKKEALSKASRERIFIEHIEKDLDIILSRKQIEKLSKIYRSIAVKKNEQLSETWKWNDERFEKEIEDYKAGKSSFKVNFN